jgi:single-strand DNA-binding protein
MAMNKVIMVGRLTADPELRKTDSGLDVTRFSIALNTATNKTDFFNVVAWRQTATFITRYFKKGDGICIDGHLESRSYEKDGVKRTVYEVICDSAGFAEGRASTEVGKAPSYGANEPTQGRMDITHGFEDIPSEEGLPF